MLLSTSTGLARPRPATDFCLPPEYRQQSRNLSLDSNRTGEPYWSDWRIRESGRYQHYVYVWAARLARRHGCHSVLDVGCGVGTKLASILAPHVADVTGIDQAAALGIARRALPHATLIDADLESPPPHLGRTFDLILCADVLEHLLDPDPVLAMIATVCHSNTLIVLSTPERHRERGRECRSSDKPEHVREWSAYEFRTYIQSRGLRAVRQRMMPKDQTSPWLLRREERAFRAGCGARSRMCCQALLAKAAA